jgi:hypothetical protein
MESLAHSGIFFLWIYFVCARGGLGRAKGEGGWVGCENLSANRL